MLNSCSEAALVAKMADINGLSCCLYWLQETFLWQEQHTAVSVVLGLPSSLLSKPKYCQTGDVTFAFATRSEDMMPAMNQGILLVNVTWERPSDIHTNLARNRLSPQNIVKSYISLYLPTLIDIITISFSNHDGCMSVT